MSTATADEKVQGDSNPSGETTVASPSPRQKPSTEPRTLPPYAVIIHNDDVNTMEFVVETLQRVFGYSFAKCIQLMLEAHDSGRSLVWSGAKEHAEFKADQIISRGPDPIMVDKGAQALRVTIEPLPG